MACNHGNCLANTVVGMGGASGGATSASTGQAGTSQELEGPSNPHAVPTWCSAAFKHWWEVHCAHVTVANGYEEEDITTLTHAYEVRFTHTHATVPL